MKSQESQGSHGRQGSQQGQQGQGTMTYIWKWKFVNDRHILSKKNNLIQYNLLIQ